MFVWSVSTPDGASELLEDVDSKVQQRGNSSLVQGTPIYGPRTLQRTMDKTRLLCSIIAIKFRFCQTDADWKKALDCLFIYYKQFISTQKSDCNFMHL